MPENPSVESLSDREVILVLSQLTQELREADPGTSETPVVSESDARAALASFLAASGDRASVDPEMILPDDSDALGAGRELLTALLEDNVSAAPARALVAEPPEDSQMSIELAIGAAVVLGLLITWLQTKVEIHVAREGGATSWSFDFRKDATDPKVIEDVTTTVRQLIVPGA